MKRCSLILLAVLLVLPLLAASCAEQKGGEAVYTLNDAGTGYHVSGFTGKPTELVIPETYQGLPVVSVGVGAFRYCWSLESITLPDSLRIVNSYAFWDCNRLKRIEFGSSLRGIGKSAFQLCVSLEEAILPDTVEILSSLAFYGCTELKNVRLPGAIGEIEENTFRACPKLAEVTILPGITAVGESAFSDCTALERVALPEGLISIGKAAFKGCTVLASVTLPQSLETVGNAAFEDCKSLSETVYSGDLAGWCGVSFENETATPTTYSHCLTVGGERISDSLVIPDDVTEIGAYAFCGFRDMVSLTLGSGVQEIGDDAFRACYRLVEVRNRSALEIETGGEANGSVGLYALDILPAEGGESHLEVDGNGYVLYRKGSDLKVVMYRGNETVLNIPDGVTEVCHYAFINLSDVTAFHLPATLKSIGDYAFFRCSSLVSLTIPQNVNKIGGYVFYDCTALEEIVFEAPEGWRVTTAADRYSGGSTISVLRPQVNVRYFKSAYPRYFWYRK